MQYHIKDRHLSNIERNKQQDVQDEGAVASDPPPPPQGVKTNVPGISPTVAILFKIVNGPPYIQPCTAVSSICVLTYRPIQGSHSACMTVGLGRRRARDSPNSNRVVSAGYRRRFAQAPGTESATNGRFERRLLTPLSYCPIATLQHFPQANFPHPSLTGVTAKIPCQHTAARGVTIFMWFHDASGQHDTNPLI